ncbi:single-stranded-DNA-specific exonuclease RecJ [Apilactobacillus micheneri]|uniref:Single-stranded-DNA-specific exonuclease RecJ n=1 Tax=Apilactobacillus micheneri TaxID=1899430 RepID=A0ABY2YYJ6_9LACO|nr:single-stranded-DNA-specific exonuclease RecJ [Apilactobacillus micheneri]TPR25691.1 single-stranded-DNA-specific exonuclease RecJ [Apilactobacillus micheneri]TPR26795.1 single-stranded-DNA-specific exonuclease RecJ [Apilactobacillus micheneri]TPR28583.1 single-stranded-DNA-specific exonuclease RecJ [Apilactobacillus micheneri]TPR29270.1 single-stranded-DNA-specific exonuclease RecJ [Apilactobacillus micheneri]TPR30858.1 single-stranded-DNA-specific exonuclease RecJ [Apilactobacillus michen
MIPAKFDWQLNQNVLSDEQKDIATKLGISPLIISILFSRGYKNIDDIKSFLTPQIENLRDPYLMHDMQKACDRIKKAIENNEKITVYGDYDADGITSTSVMYETLVNLGANVTYFIPNRFKDGYGPNPQKYEEIINDGTSLIVTVDNGISGNKSVELANNMNCDVIITDHHKIPDDIPEAYAIVHARYPGDEYPFGDFSGVGIAFKVATALLEEIPEEYFDLAAIGTVADLVSLTDENRILVKYGLQELSDTQRPGLMHLEQLAGLKADNINEQSISFGLAPRLNALGRISDATTGVKLLTTFDDEVADDLSHDTENENKKRRKLVDDIFLQASKMASNNTDKHTIIVYGDNWHEGVVGIVASRLVEKYNKPTIVMSHNPETGIYKGSGRSVEGFDLFDAINGIRENMVSFGGHSMAIGLSIRSDDLNTLINHFEDYAVNNGIEKLQKPKLSIAKKIKVSDVNQQLFDNLQMLAPFGTDNEYPIFEFEPQMVTNVQTMGKSNEHLKFQMLDDNSKINVLAFKNGKLASHLESLFDCVHVAGHLEKNTWKGRTTIQVMNDDIYSDDVEIVDLRSNQLNKSMFQYSNSLYVFFHENVYKQILPFIGKDSKACLYNNLSLEDNFDNIIFVDCPDSFETFNSVLNVINKKDKLIFYLYSNNLSQKMPTRSQYADLFRFVEGHKDIKIYDDIDLLSDYLKIDKSNLAFMINVFKELKFISIENGIMNGNRNPESSDITLTKSYILRKHQLTVKEKLLDVDTTTLNQVIRSCF